MVCRVCRVHIQCGMIADMMAYTARKKTGTERAQVMVWPEAVDRAQVMVWPVAVDRAQVVSVIERAQVVPVDRAEVVPEIEWAQMMPVDRAWHKLMGLSQAF